MRQFTPAPWYLTEGRKTISIYSPSFDQVARVPRDRGFFPGARAMANARLIVAAPELYEAVHRAIDWCDGNDGTRLPFYEVGRAVLDWVGA